jgi:fibrillarin-like rRNA methylase
LAVVIEDATAKSYFRNLLDKITTVIISDIANPPKSEVFKINSKVLSSVGRGFGDLFFIEKIIKALPPQIRINKATKNEAFRRGEATAGSVFQIIRPSPNADIIVDIPTP